MTTIVTRLSKGAPLTNTEMDANLNNLNNDKLEKSGGTVSGSLIVTGNFAANYLSSGNSLTLSGNTLGSNNYTLHTINGANAAIVGSDGAIFGGAARDFGTYIYEDHSYYIATNGAKQLIINKNGIGLSTVPTLWVGANTIETGGDGALMSPYTLKLASNLYFDGTNWRYKLAGGASLQQSSRGVHSWYSAPEGAADGVISSMPATMTLDSSGNLGLGVTPEAKLDISVDATDDAVVLRYPTLGKVAGIYLSSAAAYYGAGAFNYTNAFVAGHTSDFAAINVGGVERVRVDTAGNLGIGVAPTFKLDVVGLAGDGVRFTGNGVSTVLGESGGSGFLGTTTNNALKIYTNATVAATFDTAGNLIQTVNTTGPSLSTNKTMAFELVDDTHLKIKVRGSDGVTRSVTMTLS